MSWVNLFYDFVLKNHTVHSSVVEIAERDILNRHNCISLDKQDVDLLHIDPGGMICLKNQPLVSSFEEGNVSVRPELILGAIETWGGHRYLEESLPSGERVVKVYFGQFWVAVMPESLYHKIGAWLAFNKGEGYMARMEIIEALKDVPNIVVLPPPSEGEA